MNRRMIKSYFYQAEQYFSESGNRGDGEFLIIADMHPDHARNAARKLLFTDASFWASECGVETKSPTVWMSAQPMFQALARQALSA